MSDETHDDTERHGQPYHWFQGASVRELHERLTAIGPDAARLEVRTHGQHMYLHVVGVGYQGPPINESHICPPICP